MTTASPPPSPASWPPAPAAAPTPPGRRLDLPIIGAEYPQLLRTPRSRWWHPLLSAGFVLGSVLVLLAVLTRDDPELHAAYSRRINPYGDGQAAARTVAALAQLGGVGERLPDFSPNVGTRSGLGA